MTRLKHNAIPYDSSNWLLILEDTVWNQQSKIYQKRGCVCEEKTWSLSSYFFFFFFLLFMTEIGLLIQMGNKINISLWGSKIAEQISF